MTQPHRQNSGLKIVQPAVHTGQIAFVMAEPAILSQGATAGCQVWIRSDDSPPITEGRQVLRRIKAETGQVAEGPDPPAADRRPVRLCAILNQAQAIAITDGA